MSELIITNGDAAADILTAGGASGRIVPWRDVLHEGPLIPAAGLGSFSEVRAGYLSERFDIPLAETSADFLMRDAVVKAHAMFDRVSIWLEHDLHDQLQLLQILHFFQTEGRAEGLRLIQADDFLATQSPETVLRFADDATPITEPMLATAASLWKALTDPSPEGLFRQLRSPTGSFRFLRPALGRFIEELPALHGGLSRTEHIIASSVAAGGINARDVFARLLASEDAPFMGDWSAFRTVDDLVDAGEPLINGPESKYPCQGEANDIEAYLTAPLALTRFGRSVLSGDADMIAVNGVDRRWAGTHLQGHDCWRWNSTSRHVVPPGGDETSDGLSAAKQEPAHE